MNTPTLRTAVKCINLLNCNTYNFSFYSVYVYYYDYYFVDPQYSSSML